MRWPLLTVHVRIALLFEFRRAVDIRQKVLWRAARTGYRIAIHHAIAIAAEIARARTAGIPPDHDWRQILGLCSDGDCNRADIDRAQKDDIAGFGDIDSNVMRLARHRTDSNLDGGRIRRTIRAQARGARLAKAIFDRLLQGAAYGGVAWRDGQRRGVVVGHIENGGERARLGSALHAGIEIVDTNGVYRQPQDGDQHGEAEREEDQRLPTAAPATPALLACDFALAMTRPDAPRQP